jgi:hypothetical protein
MKIHNYSIVSTIQILKKKPVKKQTYVDNNYNDDDYSIDSYYKYDDYSDYERIECDNCNRIFLNTLLDNGLCEMCSIKRKRKLEIFTRKMKNENK